MRKGEGIVPKYIQGVLVSQDEFKERIVDSLLVGPEDGMMPAQVAATFDETWLQTDNQKMLAQTMAAMRDQGLLNQVRKRGPYTANGGRVMLGGVSRFQSTEKALIQALKDRGGFAKLATLARDLGIKITNPRAESGHGTRTNYENLRNVLAKSDLIRQDLVKKGYYNLCGELLAEVPLVGRNLYHWTAMTVEGLTGGGVQEISLDAADAALARQGAIYAEVLHHAGFLTLRGAAEGDENLTWAIADWEEHDPTFPILLSTHLAQWNRGGDEAEKIIRRGGVHRDVLAAREAAERAFRPQSTQNLWERFVAGEQAAHFSTTLDLHEAFAGRFGLDAPALSRGCILTDLRRRGPRRSARVGGGKPLRRAFTS